MIEDLNTVFDLSYLQKSGFPETEFKTIGILGGGTAGYLTALALRKTHPNIEVVVIESSKIPVIGVGESTTTEVVPFLHQFLEFDPLEFFNEVEPTIKLGIQFDWGCADSKLKKDYKFNFNFFASHHYESYFYENSIENSNWPSVLMNKKKVPVLKSDGSFQSLFGDIPFSYHIENKKFVSYLKKKIIEQGIKIIDVVVSEVNLDKNEYVESLETVGGDKLFYDVYIDCSGFRSKILGEALNTEFISYDKSLVTDRALIFNLPTENEIEPFTSAITMNSGWCWKIPMRDEDHYGYVFSSIFSTEEDIVDEINKKFGKITDYKIVNFKSGRHKKAWSKNVFSVGNSYAFVEPLESTAIQSIIMSVMLLCRLMPNSLKDKSSMRGINKEIAATWDTFRWFLATHYKFNKKLDTKFWRWCNENTDIGDAKEIISLFKQRPPLSKGHYGTSSGYTAYQPLVFNAYSYDAILFGQKIIEVDDSSNDDNIKQPTMTKEEYFEKCEAYKKITGQSVTQNELFADNQKFINEVLIPLFEDEESWIVNTQV